MMFEKPIKKRGTNDIHRHGRGWCGAVARYGTSTKCNSIDKHCKDSYHYIGIAYDERRRKKDKLYPLVDWKMTEADCLEYCYSRGYNWIENGIDLYKVLDRVSCYCCRNKNLKELKAMYQYLPDYWQRLKNIELRLGENMKKSGSLPELEKRFNNEIELEKYYQNMRLF